MEILAIKFFYCRGWLDEMTDVLLGVKLENLSFLEVLTHWVRKIGKLISLFGGRNQTFFCAEH